jgi:hypothetical protein
MTNTEREIVYVSQYEFNHMLRHFQKVRDLLRSKEPELKNCKIRYDELPGKHLTPNSW